MLIMPNDMNPWIVASTCLFGKPLRTGLHRGGPVPRINNPSYPPPFHRRSMINLHCKMTGTWEHLVQQKQADALAKIPVAWRLPPEYTNISETANTNVLDVPRRCGILSPRQLEITEVEDATALLGKIHRQELSAYEVTEAFCIRAAIAQQVVRSFSLGILCHE